MEDIENRTEDITLRFEAAGDRAEASTLRFEDVINRTEDHGLPFEAMIDRMEDISLWNEAADLPFEDRIEPHQTIRLGMQYENKIQRSDLE